MLEDHVEILAWIDPVLGFIILVIMGLFAYMSAHLVSERKAGKQIPLFWEKKEENKKKPVKKVKKAKKPAKKAKESVKKGKNSKK